MGDDGRELVSRGLCMQVMGTDVRPVLFALSGVRRRGSVSLW